MVSFRMVIFVDDKRRMNYLLQITVIIVKDYCYDVTLGDFLFYMGYRKPYDFRIFHIITYKYSTLPCMHPLPSIRFSVGLNG